MSTTESKVVSGCPAGNGSDSCTSIAARNGHPISFWKFTRYELIVATTTIVIAWGYLWLRYYAFG